MIAIAASLGAGCVAIDGGAVELSWAVRDFEGEDSNCDTARIAKVRICWNALGDAAPAIDPTCQVVRLDGGVDQLYRAFDCEDNRGVTRFEVPPGPTALFVSPLCNGDAEPTGPLQVPAPIVRTVVEGEVVTLNQILIVASDADCEGAQCTCP